MILNGLDDLLVDLLWIWSRLRPLPRHICTPVPERETAIFVPLWHEHEVIEAMVEHNIGAIEYRKYHFFIGVYPNDASTRRAVERLERRFANVHLALCPHDGPTFKADCLNWIYQRMLLHEAEQCVRFENIVVHDAEDLIHPAALREMNWRLTEFDTVQVPVFALPTPALALTHGVYCDEFGEYQTRDMPVRELLGAFIPSCGVGTAYRRTALESLAAENQNRIFEPECLTEDYENGLKLHELGARQSFLAPECDPVATREYFPRSFRAAVRQRSRWITGNVLQAWERHGWKGGLVQKYWFWRDRKGILGSPVTALINAVTIWTVVRSLHGAFPAPPTLAWAAPATAFFAVWRLGIRVFHSAKLYGPRFAFGAPVRMLHGNLINAAACTVALATWGRARLLGYPLRWVKTEHIYPGLEALDTGRKSLDEILVSCSYASAGEVEMGLRAAPASSVGEYLVTAGVLTPAELGEAEALGDHGRLAAGSRN